MSRILYSVISWILQPIRVSLICLFVVEKIWNLWWHAMAWLFSSGLKINDYLVILHHSNFFLSQLCNKVKKVEQNQPRKSTMAPPTQKVIKRLSKEIEEECYSNRNEHRGICLILEHDIFAPNLQLRFDSLFLQEMFRSSHFSFLVFGHENIT